MKPTANWIILIYRASAVVAGVGALSVLSPTLVFPNQLPAALWVVLLTAASGMAAVSVRVWRSAGGSGFTHDGPHQFEVVSYLLKSLSVYGGVVAVVLAALILAFPKRLPAIPFWFVTAEVAIASVVFWVGANWATRQER